MCKITSFLRKKSHIWGVLLRRNSWRAGGFFCQYFHKKVWRRLTTYLVAEIQYYLQKLILIEVLKLFLPRIGLPHGLKMAAFSSRIVQGTNARDIAVLKRFRLRVSDTGICPFRKVFRPFPGLIYQELAIFSHNSLEKLCLVCFVAWCGSLVAASQLESSIL